MIVVLSTLTALIVMKAHEPEKIYGCFSIVICLAGATKVEGGVEVPVDLRVWETMLRRVLLRCTRHEKRLSVGCHCASISRRYRESHRSRDSIEAKFSIFAVQAQKIGWVVNQYHEWGQLTANKYSRYGSSSCSSNKSSSDGYQEAGTSFQFFQREPKKFRTTFTSSTSIGDRR